ncbi:MAG: hypothetical protein ACTHLZ_12355 [Tepidisphaeraceae bacterium]
MNNARCFVFGKSLVVMGLVLGSVACETETHTTTEPPTAEFSKAPATQPDLAQLQAENAALRAEVQRLSGNDPQVRQAVADVKLDEHKIKSNQLEPGMTLEEASAAITGHGTIYSNLCRKTAETDSEVTYVIVSNDQKGGPGSGGAAGAGVNMRGDHPTPQTRWQCVFDKATGRLKTFTRL